tara:strand:+ start:2495 stop:3415 length:921 start_codon:yes stop_codon:yes gene_type:complete
MGGTTTYSGKLRSQTSVNLVSKDATTGLIQDRTLGGDAVNDTRRYYLYESFLQRPALNAVINTAFSNADATNAANTAIRLAEKVANRNFEALGTNMTTALCTFNATSAGIVLTTATADQDQAIIAPHLDTNQTAWQVTEWGTENQVEWECSINTNAIDNQKLWAGLKLTNDQLVATDADQAYFKFQTDATNSEAFTDFTVWHFIYSAGGTDYISALPITVEANTIYHFRISIDSDRKISIFVNGVQYNVTSTSGSTGGTAVSSGTTKSLALTDDVDLIPYIGIEAGAAAAEAVDVHYQWISRVIFE